ncbi:MAG: 2-oxoacid:ferredoxin oxidoreductase subunit beta, partial [Rhodospirillales bacterium]|nr:2-oxoacid:ferredoxin oxidoreductase subunit beta [Rhodospirillales bacterium]
MIQESTALAASYVPKDYKSEVKPVWCPGCGDYSVLMAFQKAFAELALPPEEIAVISG